MTGKLSKDQRKKAYEIALDVRKFEIELYWKRTAYFWTLIAAVFGGYAVIANGKDQVLAFLLACFGLVLSLGWYLANRGSKYWQENWEEKVTFLETEFSGPIFAEHKFQKGHTWVCFHKGYPYSVSKVNQIISIYVVIVWAILCIKNFGKLNPKFEVEQLWKSWHSFSISIFTVIFVFLMLWCGRTSNTKNTMVKKCKSSFIPDK